MNQCYRKLGMELDWKKWNYFEVAKSMKINDYPFSQVMALDQLVVPQAHKLGPIYHNQEMVEGK